MYALFDWVVAASYLGDVAMNEPPASTRRAAGSRIFRATRDPLAMAIDDMLACEAARRAGRFTLAVAIARTALGCGVELGGLKTALLSRLVHILAAVGDDAGTAAAVVELDEASEMLDMPWEGLWSAHARGMLHLLAGRADAAAAALATFDGITYLGRGVRDAIAPSLALLVEAYAASGRPEDARRVAADLDRWLDGCADPLGGAFVHRGHALAGTDDTDERFRSAVAVHRTTDDPYEMARTLLLHGEWLRRNRRPTDSREPLREAANLFSLLGAAPWAERASRELAASGETRGAGPGTSSIDLTPQELRIALGVAEGMSNTEIAASVFLSAKTVETHLTRVYRKLGVRSRGGVAKALADAGIAA